MNSIQKLVKTSNNSITNRLVYPFFIAYIAFLPIGPYPIPFLGIKVDILIAGILLILLLPNLIRISYEYPKWLISILYIYVLVSLLSTTFSQNPTYSARSFAVTVGYILVSLLAPISIAEKSRSIRTLFFALGFITSIIILVLFFCIGHGRSSRFYMTSDLNVSYEDIKNMGHKVVDPNMTAIGLYMTILFYIPNLFKKNMSIKRISMLLCLIATILIAGFTTASRTAFISITLSFVFSLAFLLIHGIADRKFILFRKATIFLIILTISILLISGTYGNSPIKSLLTRLNINLEKEFVRLEFLKRAFEIFSSSLKTVIIGEGYSYFTTIDGVITNPHNEFLGNLSTSGILGFLSFSALFAAFFIITTRIKTYEENWFTAKLIFLYIFIAVQTYGHTKSMWSAFMLILILYKESIIQNGKMQNE